MEQPIVVVVGSINLDTTLDVERLPSAGETVLASGVRTAVGGKGANQAAAAARQGVRTAFVGVVGDDTTGASLLDALIDSGVDVSSCRASRDSVSGQALITVDAAGTNTIVVAAGANATLQPADVGVAGRATVVLVQLEIPDDAVRAALEAGRAGGAVTILNPAPARAVDPEILGLSDILVPNQHEAAALTGIASPEGAAAALASASGGGTVIVTCGERGALIWRDGSGVWVPSVVVDVVDTVAAGDAFCGVLAASLGERRSLDAAVRRAAAAGAHATTIPGALPSLPTRADVDRLLADDT
jgi:ribokinase